MQRDGNKPTKQHAFVTQAACCLITQRVRSNLRPTAITSKLAINCIGALLHLVCSAPATAPERPLGDLYKEA